MSRLYLITFVLAFECFVLFFGETIITHSFAAYFSYRKDQHALKRSTFKLWRKRTTGRTTKHLKLRSPEINRAYCPSQYKR
ncbi:MAG: TIGR03643 family protein [Gammaproteobacteria bacterium]|nr:TIGR03643 family protein [Gammaproteobacteria bacterium]MBU2056779.1 TIGR03643 family protein [Gammaproteobacteria bacterium]MBU2174116.1 TIGR03643 family protein [Gammaproteobacteria bacterium]MBU2246978.1 TIGR03643 family protein [Gammaproteobacteria bacterium]MBU2343404.1 TIGR03643 family protein [Gammaproteobacteria bacterium]